MSLLFYAPGPGAALTAGTAVSGPVAYGPTISQPDTIVPPITARIIDRSTWATIVDLDQSWGRTWENVLNEPGGGELAVDNTDPDLSLLGDDDLILFELHGHADFVLMPGDIDRQTIAPNEEVDQATTIAGPGHLAVLEEAVVYPSRGVGVRPVQTDRPFNWTSPEYDDSWWDTSTVVATGTTPWWYGVGSWPGGLSGILGAWMWSTDGDSTYAPAGDVFFRRDFTVTTAGLYAFVFLADDRAHIYLDGQRIIETRNWTNSDGDTASVDIELSAGVHTVAMWAQNNPGEPGNNPAAVRGVVALRNLDGTLGTVVLGTDATWQCIAYPIFLVGMTPGEVIRVCVEEAQARGALAGLTLTFTDEVDSDGQPWPLWADVSTKVGTDYLTFFGELTNSYIDMWMSPSGFELWAWVKNTRGDAVDVTLAAPTDTSDPTSGLLLDLRHRTQP